MKNILSVGILLLLTVVAFELLLLRIIPMKSDNLKILPISPTPIKTAGAIEMSIYTHFVTETLPYLRELQKYDDKRSIEFSDSFEGFVTTNDFNDNTQEYTFEISDTKNRRLRYMRFNKSRIESKVILRVRDKNNVLEKATPSDFKIGNKVLYKEVQRLTEPVYSYHEIILLSNL